MYENLSNEEFVRELEHYADIEKQFAALRGAINEAARRLKQPSSPSADSPSALPTAPGGDTLPSPGHNFILTIPTDDPVAIRAVITQLEDALAEHGIYTGVVPTECGVDGFAVLT